MTLDALSITNFRTRTGEDYFVVGAAVMREDEDEPKEGLIYLYVVSEGRKLEQLGKFKVPGGIYSMAQVAECLLACINNTVVLFEVSDDNKLVEKCVHRGHIVALTCRVRGHLILIGDLMKSVTLLKYEPGEQKLVELARDYNQQWVNTADFISDRQYLLSDMYFNFVSFERAEEGAPEELRRRLEANGKYHLGDSVNQFRQGSLVLRSPEDETGIEEIFLYCTVSGMVGIMVKVKPLVFEVLSIIQENLLASTSPPGDWDFSE